MEYADEPWPPRDPLGIIWKLVYFIASFFLSVLFIRLFAWIYAPLITVGGYTLGSFLLGVILLGVASLMMLFGRRRPRIHTVMTGIGMGLLSDQLVYIMGTTRDQAAYNETLTSVVILLLFILLTLFLIVFDVVERVKKVEWSGGSFGGEPAPPYTGM